MATHAHRSPRADPKPEPYSSKPNSNQARNALVSEDMRRWESAVFTRAVTHYAVFPPAATLCPIPNRSWPVCGASCFGHVWPAAVASILGNLAFLQMYVALSKQQSLKARLRGETATRTLPCTSALACHSPTEAKSFVRHMMGPAKSATKTIKLRATKTANCEVTIRVTREQTLPHNKTRKKSSSQTME